MSDIPASPKANRLATPGWLDGRLVLGVLLVLVSVVVGARVLSSADRSSLVWAASGTLTAGSELSEDNLRLVRVRLFDGLEDRYVPQSQNPAGLLVARGLGDGELLPRSDLLAPGADVDFRRVTVPIDAARLPPGLTGDEQVDVWLTPEAVGDERAAAAPSPPPAEGEAPTPSGLAVAGAQPVLMAVTVLQVGNVDGGFGGGSTTVPVVLNVRPGDVGTLVSAMALGRIDLVEVPREVERPDLTDAGGRG